MDDDHDEWYDDCSDWGEETINKNVIELEVSKSLQQTTKKVNNSSKIINTIQQPINHIANDSRKEDVKILSTEVFINNMLNCGKLPESTLKSLKVKQKYYDNQNTKNNKELKNNFNAEKHQSYLIKNTHKEDLNRYIEYDRNDCNTYRNPHQKYQNDNKPELKPLHSKNKSTTQYFCQTKNQNKQTVINTHYYDKNIPNYNTTNSNSYNVNTYKSDSNNSKLDPKKIKEVLLEVKQKYDQNTFTTKASDSSKIKEDKEKIDFSQLKKVATDIKINNQLKKVIQIGEKRRSVANIFNEEEFKLNS